MKGNFSVNLLHENKLHFLYEFTAFLWANYSIFCFLKLLSGFYSQMIKSVPFQGKISPIPKTIDPVNSFISLGLKNCCSNVLDFKQG